MERKDADQPDWVKMEKEEKEESQLGVPIAKVSLTSAVSVRLESRG